ncbi:MAG: AAA family ATPase, partial [Candidatus Aerophobus sp.]
MVRQRQRPQNKKISPVIAIANQKGGVGKTNVTFNLSGALAEKNQKILLIDLDQQGNLSSVFLDSIYNLKITVADILLDDDIPVLRAIQKT